MPTNEEHGAAEAARQFQIAGHFRAIARYGSGHIHDTYRAVFAEGAAENHAILQRINTHIFTRPVELMQNIERVTTHLAAQVAGLPDGERRALRLIPTRDGGPCHVDAEGNHWRAYRFIERARSFDAVETPAQAFQAARAFGHFQQMLSSLPAATLHEIIPGFHHTPGRFAALHQAIAADAANRGIHAKPEIDFVLARAPLTSALVDAGLPRRVTHNDTKFNNVLLDDLTGEGICVIDLDTVMPGLAPYDFGDLVRTTTCRAEEDERDLAKVELEFSLFEALARGYLSTAGNFLTHEEKRHLVLAGKVITLEQGIRFLADHLAGDTYYKVHRAGHNLDRCRTQFRLIESIEHNEDAMQRLVESLSS